MRKKSAPITRLFILSILSPLLLIVFVGIFEYQFYQQPEKVKAVVGELKIGAGVGGAGCNSGEILTGGGVNANVVCSTLDTAFTTTSPTFNGLTVSTLNVRGQDSDLRYALTGGSNASGSWPISITGNAGTATALAGTPTTCSVGQYARGITASGNAANCTADANTDTLWTGTSSTLIAATGRASLDVPTRTGGDASGTWGISITGNAGSASSVAWGNVSGKPFNYSGQGGQPTWLWGTNDGSNYYVWNPSNFSVNYAASSGGVAWGNISGKPTTISGYGITDFISSNSGSAYNIDLATTNGLYYVTGASLFGQTDGAVFAQSYSSSWVGQIYQDYRTGQLALRGKNNGTWQSWRTNLDSSNYTSYAPSLTGSGASGTWGISITGDAHSVDGQHYSALWVADTSATNEIQTLGTSGNTITLTGSVAVTAPYAVSAGSLSSMAISQFTNDSGYMTASSTNTLTNKSGNISMWTNNSGYLTSFSETDPTVYAWAKAATKPSYAFSEITGAATDAQVPDNITISYAASAGNADTVDSQHFVWTNTSDNPTYLWGANVNGSGFYAVRGNMSVNYASSAGNADTVDGQHYNALWVADTSATNEIQTLGTSGNTITLTGSVAVTAPYAVSAGNADTVDSQHFVWTNTSDNPTYLWGANVNGSGFYAVRGNMSVNYASSAGSATSAINADTVDGQHYSALWVADTSSTNEIQTLSTLGDTITLTTGGAVTAPYANNAGTLAGWSLASVRANATGGSVGYATSAGNADTTDGQHLGTSNSPTFWGMTIQGGLNVAGNDNWSIEIRDTNGGGGTPFIDFTNDGTTDYDGRIILISDDMFQVDGADLRVTNGTSEGTYIGLFKNLGALPGYPSNRHPTLKTDFTYMYFSVAGAFSAYINSAGTWTAVSDRAKKENFLELDPQEILAKIDQLPMYQWNFIGEDPSIKHIAPIAQDFHALFDLNGSDDKMISNIDPSGIALVGVKALSNQVTAQQQQLNELTNKSDQQQKLIDSQQKQIDEIKNELEKLKTTNSRPNPSNFLNKKGLIFW